MIKDIAEHNATVKSNTKELQILKQYFPSCFSGEEKFDIEAFRNRIKENVTIQEEGYELNFLGKSYAKLLASLDTDTIIVPDSEHNGLPENQESKNIYISGDNLDALKHLLNSYCGQVKCIYIDPPACPSPAHARRAREAAVEYGWRFEAVPGGAGLLDALLAGAWDETRFLLCPPGRAVAPSWREDIVKAE